MKFYKILVLLFIFFIDYVNGNNCQSMADRGYCENSLYKKIMCTNCPKECLKECEVPKPDKSCHDIAENCESIKHLCNNPTYKPLMSKQCSSTCDTCPGKTTKKPTTHLPKITTKKITSKTTISNLLNTTKKSKNILFIFQLI